MIITDNVKYIKQTNKENYPLVKKSIISAYLKVKDYNRLAICVI